MAGSPCSFIYSSHPNVMQRERKVIPGTPPGWHFIPTDEELIKHYVWPYNYSKLPLPDGITIPCADVYKSHPTMLPRDFQYGVGDEFYCFTQWRPKDKGGSRIDRQVGSVFWKTNEGESEIPGGGFKKTFSFSEVKPESKGTRWIVHEFSLHSSSRKNGKLKFDHYVLCRIKPPSHDVTEDMIKELTTATSNSNEAIRGNEDISRGFMDENYQLPGPSLHQSDNLYNSTTAMTSEGTWHSLMMAVEQSITGDGHWASSHEITPSNVAHDDETKSAAISNNVLIPLQGVKADILEDSMTLDDQTHNSPLQWKGEDTWEDYPSSNQSNMG